MKKLAVITTHPIQYNAPWFRLLAERNKIQIKVFYTWSQVKNEKKFDPGFGKVIEWDIPLLEGYDYTFVNNISKNPGSKTYKGIDNPTLIQIVKEWEADAILIYGWKFKSHLKAMRYFHGRIPVLFRGDSHLMGRRSGIKNYIRKLILKNVFKKIEFALYVGSKNKDYFLNSGLNEEQLIHVPHVVDNKRFMVSEQSKSEGLAFRESFEIKPDEIVFLYAGKFETVKDPKLLLYVALKVEDTKVHFVFAGNGHLEKEMKKKKAFNIHFLNFQNQQLMPGLYQMCDVFVLPSLSETWGLSVNEAMAAGKSVLVSNACGCASDLVEEGKTGYTFISNNEDDLQRKIELLMTKKNELQNLGENALQKISHYTLEQNAIITEELLNNLNQQ